jgi:hypothetical protein
MSSRRNTVERMRTKGRRDAGTSRQGRFVRGSTGQAQAPGRVARGRRQRQPEQTRAQKVMQGIRGVLRGGGKSAAKRGKRPGVSIPPVGGRLRSLGGKQGRGAGRGRKPVMFGLLGAGAAGAAAGVARRRHRSGSSRPQASESSGVSGGTSTAAPPPAHGPETPGPSGTAPGSDIPAEDEPSDQSHVPGAEDQRD